MNAFYQFHKTRCGKTSFAGVELELDEKRASRAQPVIVAPRLPLDLAAGEVGPENYPDWFQAAINGATSALQYTRAFTNDTVCGTLVIRRIIGRDADTTEDAIQLAAGMAACELLNIRTPRISQDRPWRLLFEAES